MSFLSSLGSLTSSLFEAAAPIGAQVGAAYLTKELGLAPQPQASPVRPASFGGGGTVLGPLDLTGIAGDMGIRPQRVTQLPARRSQVGGIADFPFDPAPPKGTRVKVVVDQQGNLLYVPFRKRRRMNYLNPKALSRATRRVNGFARHVKRTRSSLRKLANL